MTTMKMAPHAAASGVSLERTGVAEIVIPLSGCMTARPLSNPVALAAGRGVRQS